MMIIGLEEEYASDESVENEPVPQNVGSIWIAKRKTEQQPITKCANKIS